MWNKFFWMIQPPTILTPEDKLFIYTFLGLLVLAIVLRLSLRLAKNEVNKRLLKKFWHFAFTIGLIGVIWGALRYENTHIFARRYWAGLNTVVGVIWLLFIVKYLLFNYRIQKAEYDRETLKSKYMPKSR